MKFADPDQVLIYFLGLRLQGFADGEFLAYERKSPAFNDTPGTDGEVTRSKTNDFRVKVVVKLMQTSASNLALSAIHNNDILAPNGAGVGTMLVQDLQGFTYLSGPKSWIVKYPDGMWDRTPKPREWEFCIEKPSTYVEGGS